MSKERKINFQKEYEILKPIGFDKYGELFLVSYQEKETDKNKLYIMEKIEVKSEEMKNEIENKVNILKKCELKYVVKIYDIFFDSDNGKLFGFIIMDYYRKGNLYKVMLESNYLNKRTIWRIFIQ